MGRVRWVTGISTSRRHPRPASSTRPPSSPLTRVGHLTLPPFLSFVSISMIFSPPSPHGNSLSALPLNRQLTRSSHFCPLSLSFYLSTPRPEYLHIQLLLQSNENISSVDKEWVRIKVQNFKKIIIKDLEQPLIVEVTENICANNFLK